MEYLINKRFVHFCFFLFSSRENILPKLFRLINFTRIVVVFYTLEIIRRERENPITEKNSFIFNTIFFFTKLQGE